MSWFKKIFSLEEENNNEQSVLQKTDLSIDECKKDISKAYEEIENINKWIIEAIHEVFDVHNKYWYDEVKKYEEIKNENSNSEIDNKVIEKCDEIIKNYKSQIKIRESKLKLYNVLLSEYEKTKEKLMAIESKKLREEKANTKLESLEKHTKRIESLSQNPEEIEKHYKEKENLNILEAEVEDVIEEFEINEEVKLHMQKINNIFHSNSNELTTENAIEEINKLVDKLKKNSHLIDNKHFTL